MKKKAKKKHTQKQKPKFKNKCLEISSFYTSATKIMMIYYAVPEIWCATDTQTDRWMDRWKK